MLRQFFSSRWMGYLALTVVFSLVATFFGLWQWDRRGQAVAAMDRVENNWDAPPLSPEEFRSLYPNVSQENEWTPLALEGTYVASDELLVRTRPRKYRNKLTKTQTWEDPGPVSDWEYFRFCQLFFALVSCRTESR